MSTQRHCVTLHPIETLLTWVESGEGDICRALIEADLVDTAVRVSAFLQSEAIPAGRERSEGQHGRPPRPDPLQHADSRLPLV